MDKHLKVLPMIFCLLLMGMFVPMMATDNVEAQGTTTIYSNAGLDGQIESFDMSYPVALAGGGTLSNDTGSNGFLVGQEYIIQNIIRRGYISFNTSSIPANERIISSTLWVRQRSYMFILGLGDFDVMVWNVNYGLTLDNSDWGVVGNLEGRIYNTSAINNGDWASLSVSPTAINRSGGNTQYKLNSSWEGTPPPLPTSSNFVNIYSGDTASPPYLTITTITESEAIITYNFTQQGMTNHTTTIYPVEIIDWNNTHQQIRYEVYLFNESYARFKVNGSFIYQSCNPWLNVTVMGGGIYNLTQSRVDFEYHHLWFLRWKISAKSTIHSTEQTDFDNEDIGSKYYSGEIIDSIEDSIENNSIYNPLSPTKSTPDNNDNSTLPDNNSDSSSSSTDMGSANLILIVTFVTLIVAVTYLVISKRRVKPPTPPGKNGGSSGGD